MKTPVLALVGLAALAVVAAGDARAPRSELISFWTGVGTPAVWVMHSDGSGRSLVTRFAQPAKRGSFSPDGLRLVFDGTRTATGPREDFDVQLVRLDGSGRRWLTDGAARDTNATWSPDGRTIVFQRRRGGGPVVDLDDSPGRHGRTTARRRLRPGPFRPLDGGSPSPATAMSTPCVATARTCGGSATERTTRRLRTGLPMGGRSSSLCSPNSYRATVWTMHADGTSGRRLTHGSYDVAAAWSPDRTRILFTRIVRSANGERGIVTVMRVDGTEVRALTHGVADEYATSWQAVR